MRKRAPAISEVMISSFNKEVWTRAGSLALEHGVIWGSVTAFQLCSVMTAFACIPLVDSLEGEQMCVFLAYLYSGGCLHSHLTLLETFNFYEIYKLMDGPFFVVESGPCP